MALKQGGLEQYWVWRGVTKVTRLSRFIMSGRIVPPVTLLLHGPAWERSVSVKCFSRRFLFIELYRKFWQGEGFSFCSALLVSSRISRSLSHSDCKLTRAPPFFFPPKSLRKSQDPNEGFMVGIDVFCIRFECVCCGNPLVWFCELHEHSLHELTPSVHSHLHFVTTMIRALLYTFTDLSFSFAQ